MIQWDDLRHVLAIARAGSLAGAARTLGVNHSTVFRRLNALEQDLRIALFERLPTGYRPTEEGVRLIHAAERMEAEAIALDRDITGRDMRLAGKLRVTSSETLAFRLLPQQIVRFNAAHPGIQVELAIDNRQLDLSRREADVALRATRPAQGDLYGRKLGDMAWTLYASDGYIAARGCPRDLDCLADHAIIGWGETALPVKVAEWLSATVPDDVIAYRSSSLINQLMATRAGLGLAALPCYLADPEPDLRRLLPPIPTLTRELWIITHADLRGTARVRAFMEIVGEGLRGQADLLAGNRPSDRAAWDLPAIGRRTAAAPLRTARPSRRSASG